MKRIRTILEFDHEPEAGLSLIEIIVAMMVFAILSVGVAFSLTSTLLMTSDGVGREVAANLAASQIDTDRSVNDVFSVVDGVPKDVTVGGTVYHVATSTNWVTSAGDSAQCGSGGGTLLYKRVNVSVTWDGMRAATPPVTSSTILSPNSRINDPTLGTILVNVLNASGTGSAGVSVTAVPSAVTGNTARNLTVAPAATDSQGCSYILKVTPGTYDVTVSKPGWVSDSQSLNSVTKTVGVAAGTSAPAGFQFDQAGKFTMAYASNYTGTVALPSNLQTSFISTYGIYVGSAATNPASLHPFPAGYTVIGGNYVDPTQPAGGCKSVDPGAWPPVTTGGVTYVGQRSAAVATTPGGTVSAPVPMGVATLTVPLLSGTTYLNAVSQATAPGTDDPGCAVGVSYTFGSVLSSILPTTITIALPFGSWKLYTATNSTRTTNLVAASAITLKTRGTVASASGIVTFDPREAATP